MESYEVDGMISSAVDSAKRDLEYYADQKAVEEAGYVERRLNNEIEQLRGELRSLRTQLSGE